MNIGLELAEHQIVISKLYTHGVSLSPVAEEVLTVFRTYTTQGHTLHCSCTSFNSQTSWNKNKWKSAVFEIL